MNKEKVSNCCRASVTEYLDFQRCNACKEMCDVEYRDLDRGRCYECNAPTTRKITWYSNDPKSNGKTDWVCEDCYSRL